MIITIATNQKLIYTKNQLCQSMNSYKLYNIFILFAPLVNTLVKFKSGTDVHETCVGL